MKTRPKIQKIIDHFQSEDYKIFAGYLPAEENDLYPGLEEWVVLVEGPGWEVDATLLGESLTCEFRKVTSDGIIMSRMVPFDGTVENLLTVLGKKIAAIQEKENEKSIPSKP